MTDLPDTETLAGLLVEVTPGPWRSVAMGGSSTVLTSEMPPRNDQRANCTYGFRGEEFCVAYPFIEDDGRSFRIDFVCFGHADARLIALAPSLAARVIELEAEVANLRDAIHAATDPDFIWGAMDNVFDMDSGLDDLAAAASRAIRAALGDRT